MKWPYAMLPLLLLFAQPPIFAQGKITVAVWGDSRENLDNACENITSILLQDTTHWDVAVHTGDFTHGGNEEDWERSLAYAGMKELLATHKFLLCTSNHDAEGGNAKRQNWDRYTASFLPVNDADGSTHFYEWHKGNVHIVLCDGYFTDSTTMKHWLDRSLKDVKPEEWLIGVWHSPAYKITYKEEYLSTCRPWLESLQRHGGDFILNGHAHQYIRTKPLLPDGTINESKGMVTVVNGTGGASWKDPVPENPMIAYTPSEKSFPCITYITLDGDTATLKTVDARPGNHLRIIDQWIWRR